MERYQRQPDLSTRRDFFRGAGAVALAMTVERASAGEVVEPSGKETGTNNIEFEKTLKKMRLEPDPHPKVDIIKEGFRPVGRSLADFAASRHQDRDHFFYIERRLQEGTPFFPGHEIYFGHASTANFFDWQVYEPVLLERPGTWEEAHVWAPFIVKNNDEYILAYTGLNRYLSQNIGLASSEDLFEWRRWDSNPISPCKGADWSAWWPDEICSCRDPHMLRHAGRVWMVYTANTKDGASCLAMTSTDDFKHWQDHGPILIGPNAGYEARLWGGHPQGSLESSNLSLRCGRWVLLFNAALRDKGRGCWFLSGDRMDHFDLSEARPFWPGANCIEVVRDKGDRSLLAGVAADGHLKFGEVNWADRRPEASFVTRDQLIHWRDV